MTTTPPTPDAPLALPTFRLPGHAGEVAKLLVHLLGPALLLLATASVFSPTIAAQVIVAIIAGIPLYVVASTGWKAAISFAVVIVQGVFALFGPAWGWSAPSWHGWVALFVSALIGAGVLVVPNKVPALPAA